MEDLGSFEELEKGYLSGDHANSGRLVGAGKRNFARERRQLTNFKAEVHYLRGLAREETGNLTGAQNDFAEAAKTNPEDLLYQREARRLLKSCIFNGE